MIKSYSFNFSFLRLLKFTLYSILFYTICIQLQFTFIVGDDNEIDYNTIYNNIISNKQVGMIEFYSSMCGGCTEFIPTWNRITEKVSSFLITDKINIDNKVGMKIAQELG